MTPTTVLRVKRKRTQNVLEDMRSRIIKKLHYHLREVRKAAKKAKLFETRKVVKRLKDSRRRGTTDEQAQLEAELNILKHFDHEPVAHTATRTKLKKDRILFSNEDVQAAIATELSENLIVPASPGTALAKVQSILLSSKIIASEVIHLVKDLTTLISPDVREEADSAEDDAQGPPRKAPKLNGSQAKMNTYESAPNLITKSDAELSDSASEGDGRANEDGWESGSIANSDEVVSDGWESGSLQDEYAAPDKSVSPSGAESIDEDESASENERLQRTISIPEKALMNADRTHSDQKKTTLAQSTFLPSLSVGYIRGDGDSEEESDPDLEQEPRKNRRGQRARRAIWEKKYGKNANHMKKRKDDASAGGQRHSKQSRRPSEKNRQSSIQSSNEHRRPLKPQRLFVQPSTTDSGYKQRPSQNHGSSSVTTPSHSISAERPSAKQDKPLHPSWEAKRKQKEMQSVSLLPSQSKKIKFS